MGEIFKVHVKSLIFLLFEKNTFKMGSGESSLGL